MRIECSSTAGLHVLHQPGGRIPLNSTAATILMMCDGRHTRRDVVVRLRGRARRAPSVGQINAFLNTACKLAWITETRNE